MKYKRHYTKSEILAKYEKRSDAQKVQILEKALKATPVRGLFVNVVAREMGYAYTDDHEVPTWIYVGGKK